MERIRSAKRIVVKVGSSILRRGWKLSRSSVKRVCEEISFAVNEGRECILVSSGAILAGISEMSLFKAPVSMNEKQALSAIGQVVLMELYRRYFENYGFKVGQILLTHQDFEDRRRFMNAMRTIRKLLGMKVIPVINENDTVATEEIKVGDNDHLSAMVASNVEADLLIMLTDTDYFYIGDEKRREPVKFIETPSKIMELIRYANISSSGITVGGMVTKLKAAYIAVRSGCCVVIANGKKRGIVKSILEGKPVGTVIFPAEKLTSRKRWLLAFMKEKGEIVIDEGAVRAISDKHKSLLPAGVVDVRGNFEAGAVVRVVSESGKLVGKGIVNVSSDVLKEVKGMRTADIKKNYNLPKDEVIHADNFVII